MSRWSILLTISLMAFNCQTSLLETVKKGQAWQQRYKKESRTPIFDAINANISKYENIYEFYTDFTKNWAGDDAQKADQFVKMLDAENRNVENFVNTFLMERRHFLIINILKNRWPEVLQSELEETNYG